ncbi:adenosine deaminase [Halioxenophilus sp. WMMB6]|uniref:adenosine deaminase n=1 Tax=Halioxenophilus sp. WMMB6 TaxID=3073815 RepID=UPI00295EDD53|nr:adenosine deaminase [Halioxenophilus sp. WMMB6]
MISGELKSAIQAMPKLELHIHLEGCISKEFIAAQCQAKNITPPRPLETLFDTADLSQFLETLDWICSLVDSAEVAAELAWQFGRYCVAQNIIYCELIVNPTHWANLGYEQLFPALSAGFDRVEAELGVDVRLLPSILRQQTAMEALALAQWMVANRSQRVVGLSVDGNEAAAGFTGDRFSPAYNLVRAAGLGCTAHAGESSGAAGVLSALDDLKVHRLDHGVRVIEDSALTERVVREGITLNVCVSSNCVHLYKSAEEHPFTALRERGVKMTLNTDDPEAVDKTLIEELCWVAEQLDLSLSDLKALQINAVAASFCDAETKAKLAEQIA